MTPRYLLEHPRSPGFRRSVVSHYEPGSYRKGHKTTQPPGKSIAESHVTSEHYNPQPKSKLYAAHTVTWATEGRVHSAGTSYGLENGAGEGNRTPVVSLEDFGSTIELHPLEQLSKIMPARAIYFKMVGDK